MLSHPAALCNTVRRIALQAGEITLMHRDDAGHGDGPGSGITRKADGSPVSAADREAEIFIERALREILPDIPMIGEESVAEGRAPALGGSEYFWLVDPLDGTREFIQGGPDFTVNIALIHNASPVLGVVYAPALGILYAAHGEGTAVRWSEDTGKDRSIRVRPPPEEGLTVVASRGHGSADRLEKFTSQFKICKTLRRASSLKICAVAEGKADLYPRFGPTCEWDTAAGQAVLTAAGGSLTDTDGRVLFYGRGGPAFLNPDFIAASFSWWEEESAQTDLTGS
ncbi:MAG: 3'(2'),5'-bisphosphate nucleotidase CysQ [Alphaproteobacteria bacterium]|nr:3'(2'),5'-bisphosphate nucleotidase CysQ [Alphaproteobacteria bacterium]